MIDERWNPGAAAERRQLMFLAAGSAAVGGILCWLAGQGVLQSVLLVLAATAASGAVAHRWIGRSVYLMLAVLAAAIGAVVSWVVVKLAYLVAIAGVGSVVRAMGMNRLARDFEECRRRDTMLADAPRTDLESFRRQS